MRLLQPEIIDVLADYDRAPHFLVEFRQSANFQTVAVTKKPPDELIATLVESSAEIEQLFEKGPVLFYTLATTVVQRYLNGAAADNDVSSSP
jgi:hypothetical protein